MSQDPKEAARKEAARRAAAARETAAKEAARQLDAAKEPEWIRQINLTYLGLMGIGVVVVQPFLTASSLDVSATVSVVAFSVALPLLAALVMVNWEETYRNRLTPSILVAITRPVAQLAAFVGVVAAFWHITWIAGVGVLAAGFIGVAVHSAGYVRLDYPRPGRAEESAGTESPEAPDHPEPDS